MTDENILEDLETVEVSLVDRPANQRKFLLMKRDMEGEKMEESVLKDILDLDLENEREVDALMKAQKLSKDAVAAVKGALKLLQGYKEQLPDQLLKQLLNMAEEDYDDKEDREMSKKKAIDMDSVPAEVREQLEALWKEHGDAVKKAEELEAALKAEKDKQALKEFIAKAESYEGLGMKSQELGAVLKTVCENCPDEYKLLDDLLMRLNTQITKGELFKEIGSDSGENASDVYGKIEAMAAQIIEKSGNELTKEKAIDRVLKSNPELYTEYMKEAFGEG